MTKNEKYLKTFFEEKDLPDVNWLIEAKDGMEHHISNEVVIEYIMVATDEEQDAIVETLRKIDFFNGDVNHFLNYLAHGLVENY